MKKPERILFLGETYRADAQTWIRGIERVSGLKLDTLEVQSTTSRGGRILKFFSFGLQILLSNFSRSYDLVLAERATSYGFFSLFVRTKKRIVAQQGITDAWPETGFSGMYKRFLQKLVYQKVDLIHAWGEVMVKAMLDSGALPAKILVMPKGMDLSVYHFVPMEQRETSQAIVTRSLSPVYHHQDILQAVFLLKQKEISVHLTLVGDGSCKETIEQQAKNLGIDNQVRFLGRIPNSSLPSFLQGAAMYLSVPETEGVSASLFEAMASGCFPIVTDLEGTRPFIQHGKNGLLVPVNNPQKLADSMELFLTNSDSFSQAVRDNRTYIEAHVDLEKNMDLIWKRYLQLFNS